jgi:nucleotidyltransferase substrate binding protein (TIGR01987 family)
MSPDIRWKQRFENYRRALATLQGASALAQQRPLTELEQQGVIQGFKFTHELAWNLLKDFLEEKGITGLIGPRDATRAAFKNDLIEDGETWMDMICDRNQSSHAYQPALAKRISNDILTRFYPAFEALAGKLSDFVRYLAPSTIRR